MLWSGIHIYLNRTSQHSWLSNGVVRGGVARAGGSVVSFCLKFGFSFRRSIVTCRIAANSGNSLSGVAYNAEDVGNDNRFYSHVVIVEQFEELLLKKWGPKTPQRLDALQVELTPMIVCRVLKKMPNIKTAVARKFFNWAKSKSGYQHNMYTYTALIDHYGRAKNFAAIDVVLAEMCEVGCGMSIVTFSSLLHWYRDAKDLAGVRRVWEHMQRSGCRPNEYAYTTYIDALAKGGCHEEALEAFNEMQGHPECQPNMFTYNVVIHSLVKDGKLDRACAMYDKLLELHQRPNFITYTILVTAHEKAGDLQKAVHFFKKMIDAGFVPSHALRSLLFTALARNHRASAVAELTQLCAAMEPRTRKPTPKVDGIPVQPPSPLKLARLLIHWGPETERALKSLPSTLPSQYLLTVFSHLSRYPGVAWRFFKWLRSQAVFDPSKYVYALVMDILGKAGKLNLQLEVLANAEAANAVNAVTYNTLLHSYCIRKQTDAALEVLADMKEHGLKPNAHTYTMLIDLLSRTRNHAQAMKTYGEMVNAGCKPNMYTYTVIIHSLARSGKVNAAATFFDRLPSLGITPNVVTYTVLIQAFLRVNDVDRALELYEAMRSDGIVASRVTLGVLTRGLQAAGLHDKAERLSREASSPQNGAMKGYKLQRAVEAQKGVEAILL